MTHYNGANVRIDLAALCRNYRLLAEKSKPGETAAVVKANAYGLGVIPIAKALSEQAGCKHFFVATLEEAQEIRLVVPDAFIGVFYGTANRKDASELEAGNFVPVLNSMEQLTVWRNYARENGKELPALLHVDTGMTRTGISVSEAKMIAGDATLLTGLRIDYFMSHLACAENPEHPLNTYQLQNFMELQALFPEAKFSLSNSSGIFLGDNYRTDLSRPGMALYGLNPTPYILNPMQTVTTLEAPILQIRTLEKDEYVGYGASFKSPKGSRLAVAAIGYADGLPRSLSNKGEAYLKGYTVPITGIVSMDLTVLDISAIPDGLINPGEKAEFYGKNIAADEVATIADTIGYELFTRIAPRVKRIYSL